MPKTRQFLPIVPQPVYRQDRTVSCWTWVGMAFLLACDMVGRIHTAGHCPDQDCLKELLPTCGWHLTEVDGTWGWRRHEEDSWIEATLVIEPLSRPIGSLELNGRCLRVMKRLGVRTIGDLVVKTEHVLLAERGFGYASLVEVQRKLADLGLKIEGGYPCPE